MDVPLHNLLFHSLTHSSRDIQRIASGRIAGSKNKFSCLSYLSRKKNYVKAFKRPPKYFLKRYSGLKGSVPTRTFSIGTVDEIFI